MALLEVRDLRTSFFTDAGEVKAVNGVSFDLERGKVLGIVGESGSGKSVTVYSIMQILAPAGKIVSGSIKLDGEELIGCGERRMREIRGNRISIIFQDPMTSLNPTYTIGHQLIEAITLHTDRNKQQAWDRAVEMLNLVNVNEPEKRMDQYPHEFSGGMRQRVMIAMALACEPDILVADEPTTALDVTIQAQILELMQKLQNELGMAIIMITHDLGVVAQMCDEIVVMYAGSYCERGTAEEIFYNPKHEYTKGLLRSIPTTGTMGHKLTPISGTPIDLLNLPEGCPFAPRCDNAMKICIHQAPENMDLSETHKASCWMNVARELGVAHDVHAQDMDLVHESVEETVEELSDIRWDAAPEEVLADDLLAHDHEKGGNE
jgi:oligopeptide transport system ATP-binding protein